MVQAQFDGGGDFFVVATRRTTGDNAGQWHYEAWSTHGLGGLAVMPGTTSASRPSVIEIEACMRQARRALKTSKKEQPCEPAKAC